jgi:hypothetical protein
MYRNTISRPRPNKRGKTLTKLMSELISLRERVAQAELNRQATSMGALSEEAGERTAKRKRRPAN